ncbi:HIT family protein [Amycolatopsis panacis]|uniref:HIT domain-containing protein n=1 Tax=Amycolatopsis panacis TaxID=2340917 RepID=A0A419HX75_9PSEU|nr:HIT domain-containing protein [Amycolatopsis panacis]RJQ81688.1 HIT domain-containing protein [Amycolatopsis panacis]
MTVDNSEVFDSCAASAYDKDCTFCVEFKHGARHPGSPAGTVLGADREDRLIWQDDELVVVPSIGPMTKGHSMVLTREHYLSFAQLPLPLLERAEKVAKTLCQQLSSLGSPIMFEHGAMSESATGGACTDHAHLHCLPLEDIDIKEQLDERLTPRRIDSLLDLVEQRERGQPYIYYRNQQGESWVYDVTTDLPCQFVRRAISSSLNADSEWDWLVHPRPQLVRATLDAVRWN